MSFTMKEPIAPVAPEKNDDAKSALNVAIAAAVVAASKVPGIIIESSSVSDWREPDGSITIKYKPIIDEWKAYNKANREYGEAKAAYDNAKGAYDQGVSIEVYVAAKAKFEEYQRKKCATAPDHEITYFIDKLIALTSTDMPEPVQEHAI